MPKQVMTLNDHGAFACRFPTRSWLWTLAYAGAGFARASRIPCKTGEFLVKFIQHLCINGLLSFPADADALELQSLNVFIGPNGAGKSNVIAAMELLRSTPVDFAAAIRDGDGAAEWMWKGKQQARSAIIDIATGDGHTDLQPPAGHPLRYRLEFTDVQNRIAILDETIEAIQTQPGHPSPSVYYRFQQGNPVIRIRETGNGRQTRSLRRDDLAPDQSVLGQRQDPNLYPEVAWLGDYIRFHTG